MYAPIIGQSYSSQGYNAAISLSNPTGGVAPLFYLDQGFPAGSVVNLPFISPDPCEGAGYFHVTRCSWTKREAADGSTVAGNLQHTVKGILLDGSYVGTVAHHITNNSLVRLNQVDPKYLALGSLLTRSITDPQVTAAAFSAPYAGFTGTRVE